MKTLGRWISVTGLVLALLVFGGGSGWAADRASGGGSAAAGKIPPGVEVAQAISTITGVAISPLLGVGGIGAWKYFKTPSEQRAQLPWFAQPWFWVPALLLVAVVFVKDTAGTALPTALKKPLDIVEVFENKISALVAAGAFVPLIAAIFQSAAAADRGMLEGTMLAAFEPTQLLNLVTVPLAIVAFFVVWMVSHVINVLIIISPFTTVDAALKSVRLALLSTVTLTSMADPYVGAAWSLIIIAVSYFLAGWALRLTVFGSVFAWDFLTFRRVRTQVHPESNRVFLAKPVERAPVRTCGRLARNDRGQLVLAYRPWLVLPRREVVLPEGNYVVGRGMFYPEVLRVEGESEEAVLTLPPRFSGHEEGFNQVYRLAGVQNVGLKAVWDWLTGTVRAKPAAANA